MRPRHLYPHKLYVGNLESQNKHISHTDTGRYIHTPDRLAVVGKVVMAPSRLPLALLFPPTQAGLFPETNQLPTICNWVCSGNCIAVRLEDHAKSAYAGYMLSSYVDQSSKIFLNSQMAILDQLAKFVNQDVPTRLIPQGRTHGLLAMITIA